jgi:dTDP-4-amino-4,6-dideoxygalactose transaminase
MVVTDDPALAERLFLFRSYGRAPGNLPGAAMFMDHSVEGYNLPLDPLEAAVVSVKLPFLEKWTQRRREIATRYAQGLAEAVIGPPVFRPDSQPTFYSYVIRIPNRDFIYTALRERGIEAGLHYVPPVYRQTAYRGGQLKNAANLPITDRLATELLGLPIPPELRDEEVQFVVETLKELLAKETR